MPTCVYLGCLRFDYLWQLCHSGANRTAWSHIKLLSRQTQRHNSTPRILPNSPQRGVKNMPCMTAALHQLWISLLCLLYSLAVLFPMIYSLLSFFSFKWSCKMSNTNYSARLIKPSFCRRKQRDLSKSCNNCLLCFPKSFNILKAKTYWQHTVYCNTQLWFLLIVGSAGSKLWFKQHA